MKKYIFHSPKDLIRGEKHEICKALYCSIINQKSMKTSFVDGSWLQIIQIIYKTFEGITKYQYLVKI